MAEKRELRRTDSMQRQFAAILEDAQKFYADSGGQDLKDFMNPPMKTTEDLMNVINRQNEQFETFRSRRQKLFHAMTVTMRPLELVGDSLAGAASELFAPSQNIYCAVMHLINAAKNVSACYDSIIELFGQLQDFTIRLKFYISQRLSAELHDKVVKILVAIFEVFVLATNEVRRGRLKAYFKRLFGSESRVPGALQNLATLTEGEEKLVIAETMVGVKKSLSNQERLAEMMSRVDINVQTLRAETRERSLSSNKDKLKDILRPSVYAEDAYLALNRTRTSGTGDWILEDPTLNAWLAGEIRFLWICGNPGTGKSYLTSRLISWGLTLLSQQETSHLMGYFFFRQTDPETRSINQALRDIAYQISEDDVFYGKQLLRILSSSDDVKTVSSAFRRLFIEPCIPDKWKRHIYVLLDGLDEADQGELNEFLSLLNDLHQQSPEGTRVQIALIGRNALSEKVLGPLENDSTGGQQVRSLHVTSDRNGSDVVSYITEGVHRARILRGSDLEFKLQIIDVMTKQVDGLFILAKFMLAELNRIRHPRRIIESLQSYPKEINGMLRQALLGFSSTLTNDEAQDLNEILRWVACAEMSLTLEHIEAILALKAGDAPLGLEESLRGQFSCFFTLEREDGLTTADLVDRHEHQRHLATAQSPDRGTGHRPSPDGADYEREIEFFSNKQTTWVTFFHASVNEFFHNNGAKDVRADANSSSLGFDLPEARIHILKTCLRIFTDPAYFRKESHALRVYAAWYWQEHLSQIDISQTSPADKADIGRQLFSMLTEEPIVLGWTNLFQESLDIWSDKNIEAVRRWMSDADVLSGLPTTARDWAAQAATRPSGLIEPIGRIFAKSWLLDGTVMYMPTLFCFGVVQSLALMETGLKWSDSDFHWEEVPLKTRVKSAAEWANQKKTAHWYRRVGSTLLNLGLHDEALIYYNLALSLDQNIVETCGRMGVCHAMSGRYEQALKLHLMCEVIEKDNINKGAFATTKEINNSRWRLYKNLFQIAYCLFELGRVEESLIYCRKAMANAYDNPLFEPEAAYLKFLSFSNRVSETMALLLEMDGKNSDEGDSRLVYFLLSQIPDDVIKDWIPEAASRTGHATFIAERYQAAIRMAADAQDPRKEYYLRNARGTVYMWAQEYDTAVAIQEEICFVDYKPRGSMGVRVQFASSFRNLARLYYLKALQSDATLQAPDVDQWIVKLERLKEQQKKHQNRNVPLHMVGFDVNEASVYLVLFYRRRNREADAFSLLSTLIPESLAILEDEEPQNDEYGIRNLQRTLIAVGDDVNARALWQSTRMPSTVGSESMHLTTRHSGRHSEPRMSSPKIGASQSPKRHRNDICLPKIFSKTGGFSPAMACDYCSKLFAADEDFAVCWYCIDGLHCLTCLENVIKPQDFSPSHISTCKSSHGWIIIPPLDRELRPGEILVDGQVHQLVDWKNELRRKWVRT